ncbi:DNA-binding response regulator [Suicoccus acidiformans]|uniref:Heme response regulator HssR n=1 Tax=Suicoccus acidiformans TaxID=2036206 RepID=A0A347WN80_9LACT|nr:response regulator transcription factor [Suicoccus acidiformans]AXY26537.1 DNA-binding response regulator [Suicoccus acidiformans]
MSSILVLEDDKSLAEMYQLALEKNFHTAHLATSVSQALTIMEHQHIDLLIVDVMMPGQDGYQFTEMLREAKYEQPILMITAKGRFEDKQRGFETGVDDYMVKPIDIKEMLLRVDALLRRANINNSNYLQVGKTALDLSANTVTFQGETYDLPQKEFLVLHKLLSYENKIFTRQQLMDEIWGYDSQSDERTVDVHIKRLRDRFKDNEDFSIITVRGLGYKAVIHETI